MKNFLLMLSLAALSSTTTAWARQADTISHDFTCKPALTQPVAQKDKSAAMKGVEQCKMQKEADDYPFLFIPLSSTEPDDPMDQREGGAVC